MAWWNVMAKREKEYYRHSERGDLGWLVEKEGHLMIQLDRPGEQLVAYSPQMWVLDTHVAHLSRLQIATVAYAADMQLAYHTGVGKRKEWLNLTEDQRIEWMRNGPPVAHVLRRRVYLAVLEALKDDASEGG
jgi:hypothetical protein